jgi:rod shape-determining protein MreB
MLFRPLLFSALALSLLLAACSPPPPAPEAVRAVRVMTLGADTAGGSSEYAAEVRGRELMSGLPKTVVLTPEEIRFAIDDVVSSIVSSVVRCLAKAPPELAQDFLVRGMYLVGGGGLLRGLDARIERETQVPVKMSNMPLEAVVLGAGHCIEHYDALKGMFMGARR